MMNEEKLRSIAVKAFNGSDFYISTYRGNPYLTEIKEDKLYLFSQSSLNQKSTENDGIFATKIKIEDLTGVSIANCMRPTEMSNSKSSMSKKVLKDLHLRVVKII